MVGTLKQNFQEIHNAKQSLEERTRELEIEIIERKRVEEKICRRTNT